jgi:hypothetical protein
LDQRQVVRKAVNAGIGKMLLPVQVARVIGCGQAAQNLCQGFRPNFRRSPGACGIRGQANLFIHDQPSSILLFDWFSRRSQSLQLLSDQKDKCFQSPEAPLTLTLSPQRGERGLLLAMSHAF